MQVNDMPEVSHRSNQQKGRGDLYRQLLAVVDMQQLRLAASWELCWHIQKLFGQSNRLNMLGGAAAAAAAAAAAVVMSAGVCMRDEKGNVFVVFRWDQPRYWASRSQPFLDPTHLAAVSHAPAGVIMQHSIHHSVVCSLKAATQLLFAGHLTDAISAYGLLSHDHMIRSSSCYYTLYLLHVPGCCGMCLTAASKCDAAFSGCCCC
jgi:hypothetical protein